MADTSLTDLKDNCTALLTELELLHPGQTFSVEPLTGGVSSDIIRVSLPAKQLCVKFARRKLKVAADWFAPLHRNAAEYAWLQAAATVAPQSAIKLYGHSATMNGFAMEYITGDDTYLWKSALLSQAQDNAESSAVGSLLGAIHAASAQPAFDSTAFQNRQDFYALRIEPYLIYTAARHTDISNEIKLMADHLQSHSTVLIHGDVSPKNILLRSNGPVLLDAECATMGDACFDLAFCLNHLLLKSIHLPAIRQQLLNNVTDFWQSYEPHIHWEPPAALQARTCRLIPMLMLARVDGKSPVEYLNEQEQSLVRHIAMALINTPATHLSELTRSIKQLTVELAR